MELKCMSIENLEEAIKKLCNELPSVGLTNERANFIEELASNLEREFVAFKKDYASKIHVSRKKLEDFNVFEWLKENHRDKERFAVLGANLIETLQSFIKKELLEEKTK